MKTAIDPGAGFCFGVKRAIQLAEEKLADGKEFFSLGQIVHNKEEEIRLNKLGMSTIDQSRLDELHNSRILLRAHGEPPETYLKALQQGLEVTDATCKVVLKIQEKVKKLWLDREKDDRQIVIVGKNNHPEVIGLAGNAGNQAIVVETISDLEKVDTTRPVYLFAQTTADEDIFEEVKTEIEIRLKQQNSAPGSKLFITNSICSHVKNRKKQIVDFARKHDLIIFVGDKNSSNSRYLFNLCQKINTNSFFVENESMIREEWLNGQNSIGITGATSTPIWLLKKIEHKINPLKKD